MVKKSKFLIILMSLFLSFSSLAKAQNIITEIIDIHKFSDVDSSDVEILYLNQIDVVRGTPDGLVLSENPLNRAETLALLARFFNLEPQFDPNCTFSDVSPDVWFAGYVSVMCNRGLVRGYPDGTFRASNQLRRAEALAMFVRGIGEIPTAPFRHLPPDVDSDIWYAPYAEFAARHNLFTGVAASFDGGNLYRRRDMFQILYRYARIRELGVDVYDASLDPQVVSAVARKNSNVTFEVTGANEDVSAYFNSLKTGGLNGTGVTLPTTYKQAAYDLIFYWQTAMNGQNDINFLAKIVNHLKRIPFMPDVDFSPEIRTFYNYFGLDASNLNINATITTSDLETVINNIKEKANTYQRPVDDLKISFLVKNSRTISIIFDGMQEGEYGWINGWDPQYERVVDAGNDHFNLQPNSLIITNDAGEEIAIAKAFFESKYAKGIDENGKEYIKNISSFVEIQLEDDLQDRTNYVLQLKPLMFRKDIRGHSNIARVAPGLYFTNVYLPASKFEFVNNSAKKFYYTGRGNQNLAGVAIENDILTTWNNLPLRAIAYSEDGRTLDIEPGQLQWSIVDGRGEIFTDAAGIPRLRFGSINSEITVKVRYHGFEDTQILYYRARGAGI